MKYFTLTYKGSEQPFRMLAEKFAHHDYEIITERQTDDTIPDFRHASDLDRYIILKKNPNAIYWDADVIVNKLPDFELEPGYPYLYYHGGSFDPSVIIGNGCSWFFDLMIEKYDINKPVAWWVKLINEELREKIKPIPEGYFKHLFIHNAVQICRNSSCKVILSGYSIQCINGQWEIKKLGR